MLSATPCRVVPAFLALLFLAATAAAQPAAIPAEIRAEVAQAGSARVIVELADPAFVPGVKRRGRVAPSQPRIARTRARVEALLPAGAKQRMRRFDELPLLSIAADAATLAALQTSPDVAAVHVDRLYAPTLNTSIPVVGADITEEAAFIGTGKAVAIIDTGVDKTHSTFGGRVVEEACYSLGGDCPGGATAVIGTGAGVNCTFSTSCFHGTHVAGIAAGADATYTGVAPGADIVAINVFTEFTGSQNCGTGPDPCPLAYTTDIISGLLFARSIATSDIAAVNLSLGGGQFTSQAACDADDPPMTAEIAAVRAAGIAPVASSGNEGYTNAMGSPGCVTGMISVGNTNDSDIVSSTSNSASFLTLLAPGSSIRSAVPPILFSGSKWQYASGTSMAAPHVAGAFAVMRSAVAGLSVDAGLAALTSTGQPVTDARNGITKPRIDVELALESLAPAECFNGLDDDFDGQTDYPNDLGCATGFWPEAPACQDGNDNDGDSLIDHPADPGCSAPSDGSEGNSSGVTCGLGVELLGVLPLLAAARRRRQL